MYISREYFKPPDIFKCRCKSPETFSIHKYELQIRQSNIYI